MILPRDSADAFIALAAAPPRSKVPPPDLTKGEAPTAIAPWNLGPTGASGYIFAREFDSSDARQILVKHIEKGSPAAGVLEVGDIIVGVNGRVFSSDARIAFATAIERAEKPNTAGIASGLDVLCVRDGKRMKVTVPLSSMASYSASAPYDCAKSSAIVAAGLLRRDFPAAASTNLCAARIGILIYSTLSTRWRSSRVVMRNTSTSFATTRIAWVQPILIS